jgi:nitrite reductase/ring-hydroxylating ferredoxin subunit
VTLLSEVPYSLLILRIYVPPQRRDERTGVLPRAYVAVRSASSNEGSIVEERISRRRFIRLGTVLGVGAAGASVLAACGGGSGDGSGGGGEYGGGAGGGGGSPDKSSGKKTDGGTEEQASGGQAIAQASEVAPGSAIKFKDAGNPALLVHLQSGDFVAYSAVCTHQQCTVAYKNGQLACPCHGSVFDPANNGQVISPPAQRPLPEIPVEVRGGEVFRA